jgi:hypothetical protein
MWQAEEKNRPPGLEEIEHDVSPLLNCPWGIVIAIATCTVVPGVDGPGGVNARVGVGSTLNGVDPVSPVLPVTVTVYGFSVGSAPVATTNEPLTTPAVDTEQLGDVMMFAGVEVIMQFTPLSWPLNAVPWMVILVFAGPSEGTTATCGAVTGGATVNVSEAESPSVPLTVTV